MRQITVDFTSQTYPLFAGYLGEHNATELIAVKPVDMSGAMYSLAFMTNGEVIHSKYFSADEEIKVALWQQLTLDNDLYVQLEAYDDNGDYLGKSTTAKLVLSNSVHGTDMVADADNPDVYSEIAQNSAFRETLEDNVETLDKLTTSALGGLLFDGKPVGDGSGGGGISDELYQEIVANTEARHTHENKDILDKFGINTAKTRPTFYNGLTDEVIATQGDILSRVTPLQQTVPNSATVDGSTLKMQRKVGQASKDLFSVELPENIGNGGNVDLSNYYTIPEADEIFAKKSDIPIDESYELIGQTPLTLENGGNIKLVADGEASYSMVSPTVWNFDDAELTFSNVELTTDEGYYKFTVNTEAAKHSYCYASFVISGLEVGRAYKFIFDTVGRTYDTANRIWTGALTAYHGTSNAGDLAFSGKALKNGNFEFAAADTSLYVRYVCAMNTTPYLGWVAGFNKMCLNYADMSEEFTEIYNNSGNFTDAITLKAIPNGVTITTDPTASVYRKAPTDKTLTQSDVPADAEETGKQVAEVKSYLPLFGKTIVNFGDSIFGQAQPPNDVSTFLANKTGATVYNCGFGGCRMSQHPTAEYNAFSMFNVANAISSGDFTLQENAIASTDVTLSDAIKANFARLKTVDFSKVDIVTIAYSTNDWNGSVALDNEENLYDTATIGGALRTSIETLLTAYPNVKIFVLSTTWRFWHDENNFYTDDSDTRTNSNGLKLADYNAKLKAVAEEYNLPYVDDYNIGINKFNRSQYFSATDGTHHNETGRKLIAEHLAKELY